MVGTQSLAKQGLDEWEEVADDYSVVSLSSDDEEGSVSLTSATTVRKSPSTAAEVGGASSTAATPSKIEDTSSSRPSSAKETSHSTATGNDPPPRRELLDLLGTSLLPREAISPIWTSYQNKQQTPTTPIKPSNGKEIEELDRDVSRLTMDNEYADEAESSSKHIGTLCETLDLDDSAMNPTVISQKLESLGEYILDTFNRTGKELTGFEMAGNIANSCQALLANINDLRPILADYAVQWDTGAEKDIPLDPSLTLWMDSLRTVISRLRRKARAWPQHSAGEEAKIRASLAKYAAALNKQDEQMQEFLPIIQADFNSYRTQNIQFPIETAEDSANSPGRSGRIPTRPTDRLSQVREALYTLKDQVQNTIHVLAVSNHFLPHPASETAVSVVQCLRSTVNAASLALTNNGSEWLESDSGRAHIGLLSHAEFSNLDPAMLRDYTTRLKQICNLVSDPNSHQRWSEEMIRDHYVYMLVEQEQLDALHNIASALEEMLLPQHMKTKTEFDDFLKEM
ncbi:hypothetical protein CORC01_08709 [Colletotrichum orchidophilum]|uniref:Uncharacterized protein n=1 Tax=Colletotrichum orchidophilum TaxID=1209926 RepID=A0A1G4B3R9_9PEZI|nr:uncharacterized protein CORC01_08709 [Colletotrichum orchidophilum]OHE96016.1 hypothetical protein CORC01_08709 [Colletotrichum orchidophilum]